MPSPLPRVSLRAVPTTVGYRFFHTVVEDWRYDALLVSEGHRRIAGPSHPPGRVYKARPGRGGWHWSGGGPFYVVHASGRHYEKETYPDWKEWGLQLGPVKVGGVYPPGFGGLYAGVPYLPPTSGLAVRSWKDLSEDLEDLYIEGFQRARPDAPQASLGQFLVELRDLPRVPGRLFHRGAWTVPLGEIPRVLRSRLAQFLRLKEGGALRVAAHEAAHETLNWEFGWRPFVADLRAMYSLWQDIDKAIARLVRDNGQWKRRGTSLGEETTVDTLYDAVGPYTLWGVRGRPPDHIYRPASSRIRVVRTERRRRWFVGSFRYWIPDTSSSLWTTRARAALFGALPTPELLWEVMPWSWLVDWFADMGTFFGYLSPGAVDNLVCERSYTMEHKETILDCTCECTQSYPGDLDPDYMYWPAFERKVFASRYTLESKARVQGGHPFGGLRGTPLNERQLTILAALGLSRVT